MVTLVKHEWHSVDSQFALELDEDKLSEIYPDMDEDQLASLLQQIENGEIDIEDIVNDAWENDVELEWERQYDDWYSDRKGGYDVTYELGDDDSWHSEPPPPEPTHKCTKCKWQGQEYDADWVWTDKEGNELDESRQVCPYCESDLELTPDGVVKEEERKKRMTEIEEMISDLDDNE